LEFNARDLAKLLPGLNAVVVTALKLYHVGIGSCLEQLLLVESLLGILVKGLQITDLGSLLKEVWEALVKLSDKHTKLGAPVAHVVGPEDFIAQEFEDTADTVTLDG
jgi:hypothetical protein